MKEDLTYYEMLDVPSDASLVDIRSAFREIQAVYDKDSLSTYSLFSDGEREEILAQAEKAFSILMDTKKRADYDETLMGQGKLTEKMRFINKPKMPVPVFTTNGENIHASQTVKQKIEGSEFQALKKEMLAKRSISGPELKALRQAAQITLSDIFEMSRVSVSTLEAIEAQDRDRLPSGIYLKGFLKSYAECLGVDSAFIVSGYISNLSTG